MLLIEDEALILDSSPFRDRHLLLTALTRGHGMIRGVLRRARGGRSTAGAATQVLSLVQLSAHHKSGAEMVTVRQVELLRSSYPLASDLGAAAAAAVVAELLITFCPVFEPAERRYRLGTSCLGALLGGIDAEVVVAYAQMWMLSLSGLLPPLELCISCGADTTSRPAIGDGDGQPRCTACSPADSEVFDSGDIDFLRACRTTPVAELNLPLSRAVGRWLNLLVRREAERPLKALDFFLRHAVVRHG